MIKRIGPTIASYAAALPIHTLKVKHLLIKNKTVAQAKSRPHRNEQPSTSSPITFCRFPYLLHTCCLGIGPYNFILTLSSHLDAESSLLLLVKYSQLTKVYFHKIYVSGRDFVVSTVLPKSKVKESVIKNTMLRGQLRR